MNQSQNNLSRFAGPSMIQDFDHMSGIPQVNDQKPQGRKGRQVQQGQSDLRDQSSGNGLDDQFEYHNPRQYS